MVVLVMGLHVYFFFFFFWLWFVYLLKAIRKTWVFPPLISIFSISLHGIWKPDISQHLSN